MHTNFQTYLFEFEDEAKGFDGYHNLITMDQNKLSILSKIKGEHRWR